MSFAGVIPETPEFGDSRDRRRVSTHQPNHFRGSNIEERRGSLRPLNAILKPKPSPSETIKGKFSHGSRLSVVGWTVGSKQWIPGGRWVRPRGGSPASGAAGGGVPPRMGGGCHSTRCRPPEGLASPAGARDGCGGGEGRGGAGRLRVTGKYNEFSRSNRTVRKEATRGSRQGAQSRHCFRMLKLNQCLQGKDEDDKESGCGGARTSFLRGNPTTPHMTHMRGKGGGGGGWGSGTPERGPRRRRPPPRRGGGGARRRLTASRCTQ